ncbi:UNVERIFIED_CONTAM: hypothetical protein K2H54_066884 [Gekko kuhli]
MDLCSICLSNSLLKPSMLVAATTSSYGSEFHVLITLCCMSTCPGLFPTYYDKPLDGLPQWVQPADRHPPCDSADHQRFGWAVTIMSLWPSWSQLKHADRAQQGPNTAKGQRHGLGTDWSVQDEVPAKGRWTKQLGGGACKAGVSKVWLIGCTRPAQG